MNKHRWRYELKDLDICVKCGIARTANNEYFDPTTNYYNRVVTMKRPECGASN